MLRAKVGLFDEQPEDEKLITDLLDWMQQTDSTTPIPLRI